MAGAVLLVAAVRSANDSSLASCDAPSELTRDGELALPPFSVTGFSGDSIAVASRSRGQVRLILHRRQAEPESVELSARSCATTEPVPLIGIGAERAFSTPTTFPRSAAGDTATLLPEHAFAVLVAFPSGTDLWRLTTSSDGNTLGAIVIGTDA